MHLRFSPRSPLPWALTLSMLSVWAPDSMGQVTERLSLSTDGVEPNDHAFHSSTSANGRFTVFTSRASNLVFGDTNATRDVFLHDRLHQRTTRVSVDSSGNEANDLSEQPKISADGRFIAFVSAATNLVPGDTNSRNDVFVHDRLTSLTTIVSVSSGGLPADNNSYLPDISADGRFVAFGSSATNLVDRDTNEASDIFVHDRLTGETTLESVSTNGRQVVGITSLPSISDDGRFVTFFSDSDRLVPSDTNGWADVFLRDRLLATTRRISEGPQGQEGNRGSLESEISGDGRLVAFASMASNLIPDDTNGHAADIFVKDLADDSLELISVATSGGQGNDDSVSPRLSGDGRWVAFSSDATNLVPGDINGEDDVFIHDRQTAMTTQVSVDSDGIASNAVSSLGSISADGRHVSFNSSATNLVDGDLNGFADVYLHGAELTLEANDRSVSQGDPLTLTTWRGQAGLATALTIETINGTFDPTILFVSTFDAEGLFQLGGTVPGGLAGLTIGFRTLAIGRTGTLVASDIEEVQFE